MLKRLTPLLAGLAIIAGCGGTTHPTKPSVRVCSGLTGKCITYTPRLGLALGSARGRIPDVSSFQGHPNWAAAKAAGIAGAIFKAGEFVTDPDAAFNNAQLRALHIWRAFYWFVRNTGCQHEAAQIIAAARGFGVRMVINDLEVPEAAGYGACLVPAERHAGLIPVDYTAPGTFPGGGFGLAPLWQAEYGPTLHPFWHPVVAWQCTDGRLGCVTFVPGIGLDDVSLNLGITRLGVPPTPKPKPKPKPRPKPPTFNQLYDLGFQRCYIVHWDRRHHRKVPPTRLVFSRVVQLGCHAGYGAAGK